MALRDDLQSIAHIEAFRALEAEALQLLALSAETRILRTGDVLFRAGERSDCGYVLLGGSIRLETPAGAEVLVTPPSLLGEAALLTSTLRPATAQVLEPSTVLAVSRSLYRKVLSEYPASALRLRGEMVARLKLLQQGFENLDA